MIFKFDKVMSTEGDNDMSRKNKDKDKFSQMDSNIVDTVKEEILNMSKDTITQTSAGFENLDESNENETIQEYEMELVKQMESENDGIWEEPKPTFGSLSEKMKTESGENTKENQMSKVEFNKEFNELEIKREESRKKKEANKLKKEMKSRLNNLVSTENKSFEFNNVLVTMRDGAPKKFHLSLSVTQLSELYISGRIFYDQNSQRGIKSTKSKGDIPLINVKHTKDILNSIMSSSSVNGGCIYLNYAKENEDELVYDSENNTLSGNSPLSILDGAHRLEAMVMWYRAFAKAKDPSTIKNPNDFYFPVTIENATYMESKNIFVELNSFGLPISKTRIAFHDVFNPNNMIAQKVMENCFRGKIEVISNSLKRSSPAVMTFGTLLKGCSLFSPATKSEANDVSIYLCDFWDEIIELFPKIYGNVSVETRQIEKANTFIGEVMFVHALFGLALELQSVEDWKDKLKKLKQPNFLNRDNDLWTRNITRNEGKLINTSKTQDFVKNQLLAKIM